MISIFATPRRTHLVDRTTAEHWAVLSCGTRRKGGIDGDYIVDRSPLATFKVGRIEFSERVKVTCSDCGEDLTIVVDASR